MRCIPPLLILLAGPAAAQTDETCTVLWEATVGVLIDAGLTLSDPADDVGVDGDVCSATHFTLDLDQRQSLTVARLGWQGLDLEALTRGEVPGSITLTVDDLRLRTRIAGNPFLSWAIDVQNARYLIDLRLEASWDAETGRLEIADFSADFPGDNSIALSLALSGVDLAPLLTASLPPPTVVFEGLTAEIETNGLFEQYALIPFADAVMTDAIPPEAQLAALQEAWTRDIRDLPDDQVDPESQEAMVALLNSLPSPSGLLTIVMGAEDGLDMNDLTRLVETQPDSAAAALAELPGLAISVDWQEVRSEGP